MTPDQPTFDLLEEPWIACLMRDGSETEFSLREVFRRADDIRTLTGEVPPQTLAMLRLLLAVLYRALDDYGYPEDWATLWADGLPAERIDAYLDRHAARFDLLHPVQPFFQVADLQTAKAEFKDASPLVFDLPANNRLFTTRSGAEAATLSYAEAARSLVTRMAFDPSGIKSGAVGDERVKGGRGYPIGVAWTGLLGGVFVEGRTLHETLLLNLVAPSLIEGADPDDDLPPWERPPLGAAVESRVVPGPTGPVDLYTWPARRIRLLAGGGRITGCLIANGDPLTPQNRQRQEPMSAWRRSRAQQQKLKLDTVYMPREHLPERALWRGISALVARRGGTEGATGADTLPPLLIEWLDRLRDAGSLPEDQQLRLRAIGVLYGSNQSVIDEVVDDSLLVALAVLREDDSRLATTAELAVERTDKGVRALATLAGDLALAAGGSHEGPRLRASEEGYAALDAPFRRWLAGLAPGSDLEAVDAEWDAEAVRILRRLGDEHVARAGLKAWRGREVSPREAGLSERDPRLNTPRAEGRFRGALARAFGPAAGEKNTVRKENTA